MTARFLVADVFDGLRSLETGSVDLILTSPPFLALRSYLPADHPDKAREIGSEPTPADYLDTLLDVVVECRRVLAPHGTLVFELGDSFSGSGGAGGDYDPDTGLRAGQPAYKGSNARKDTRVVLADGRTIQSAGISNGQVRKGGGWPLDKSLCGIPTLFAWSLAYGRNLLRPERTIEPWRIRNVIAWCRPNPPVGALGDKFRPATSYMTVACTGPRRWFDLDAVREDFKLKHADGTPRDVYAEGIPKARHLKGRLGTDGQNEVRRSGNNPAGAPPLDWWEIPTEPYSGSHYACVDDATEALTPDGWKRHDELADGDLIAAYDLDSDRIVWQPAKFVRYTVDDEIVAIDKEQTSQWLTTNHRMLVRSVKKPDPFVKLAGEVSSGYDLMLSAPWGETVAEGPGEKMAALLGWFITEGSAPKGSRQAYIYQSQSANPAKVDTIRALLDAVGADYRERVRVRPAGSTLAPGESIEVTFVINGDLAAFLRANHKRLDPAFVFGWPEAECRALLDAMIDGDGHRRANGRWSFTQKDRTTCDTFQALAIRCGFRAVVKERPGGFVVYGSVNRWVTLRGPDGARAAIPRRQYQGIVWCPQVRSTFWLARRDGKPFITGNTWPRRLLDRPILAMCPRRVCRTCGQPSNRITEVEYEAHGERRDEAKAGSRGRDDLDLLGQREQNAQAMTFGRATKNVETLGWSDCGCSPDGSHWRSGVVLDPFCGSGTTLAVAVAHGREAVGIDLDARNADLAVERCGMFLTVEVINSEVAF